MVPCHFYIMGVPQLPRFVNAQLKLTAPTFVFKYKSEKHHSVLMMAECRKKLQIMQKFESMLRYTEESVNYIEKIADYAEI